MAVSSAGAASAAARRRLLEEEEEMTRYSERELEGGWEFKIVRANIGVFRNPAELEKLRKEEALAGWVLLEKFDNSRVRFKRPLSARQDDGRLPQGVDPYRTHYGMSPVLYVILLTVAIIGASLVFTWFLFLLVDRFVGGGI